MKLDCLQLNPIEDWLSPGGFLRTPNYFRLTSPTLLIHFLKLQTLEWISPGEVPAPKEIFCQSLTGSLWLLCTPAMRASYAPAIYPAAIPRWCSTSWFPTPSACPGTSTWSTSWVSTSTWTPPDRQPEAMLRGPFHRPPATTPNEFGDFIHPGLFPTPKIVSHILLSVTECVLLVNHLRTWMWHHWEGSMIYS